MIYSRWRPDSGQYDYFDDGSKHNINDDLPTPELDEASKIGVPSIEAGRPIPSGAHWVGSGPLAVGVVAPVDARKIVRRTRSLAGESGEPSSRLGLVAVGGAAALVIWLLIRRG